MQKYENQETRHYSCLSVNCTMYGTILRHKVDDLGFRTYEKPFFRANTHYCGQALDHQYIHTEIDIDIDCSAERARPTFLFYFGDTLEDLLRLKLKHN